MQRDNTPHIEEKTNDSLQKQTITQRKMAKDRKASFDVSLLENDNNIGFSATTVLSAAAAFACSASNSVSGDESATAAALKAADAFDSTNLTGTQNVKSSSSSVAGGSGGGTAREGCALDHLDALSTSGSAGKVSTEPPRNEKEADNAEKRKDGTQTDKAKKGDNGTKADDASGGSAATLDHSNQRLLVEALLLSSGERDGSTPKGGRLSNNLDTPAGGGGGGLVTGIGRGGQRDRFESWGGMSDLSVAGLGPALSHPAALAEGSGSAGGGGSSTSSFGGGGAAATACALAASALQQTGIIDDVTAAAAATEVPSLYPNTHDNASAASATNSVFAEIVLARSRRGSVASMSETTLSGASASGDQVSKARGDLSAIAAAAAGKVRGESLDLSSIAGKAIGESIDLSTITVAAGRLRGGSLELADITDLADAASFAAASYPSELSENEGSVASLLRAAPQSVPSSAVELDKEKAPDTAPPNPSSTAAKAGEEATTAATTPLTAPIISVDYAAVEAAVKAAENLALPSLEAAAPTTAPVPAPAAAKKSLPVGAAALAAWRKLGTATAGTSRASSSSSLTPAKAGTGTTPCQMHATALPPRPLHLPATSSASPAAGKDMEAIRARARAAAGYVPCGDAPTRRDASSAVVCETPPPRPPLKKRPRLTPNNGSAQVATPASATPNRAPLSSGIHSTPRKAGGRTPSTPGSTSSKGGQSNQKWDDMFDCLVAYVAEQRVKCTKGMTEEEQKEWEWDGNVPTTYKTKDGKALGRWINNQRSAKSKGSLKKDRDARLVSTGLKWSVLTTNSWTDMMDELRIYVRDKTSDGKPWDGNVPTNYRIRGNTASDGAEIDEEKNLGRWINRQRSLFQAGKLKKDRQVELEKIGLKWSVLSTTSWQSMYEALCKYAEEKKALDPNHSWDGNVPANHKTNDSPPKSLGRWVNRQRSAYAKKKLKKNFVDKLESIGLRWAVHDKSKVGCKDATTVGRANSDDDDETNPGGAGGSTPLKEIGVGPAVAGKGGPNEKCTVEGKAKVSNLTPPAQTIKSEPVTVALLAMAEGQQNKNDGGSSRARKTMAPTENPILSETSVAMLTGCLKSSEKEGSVAIKTES